MVSQYLRISKSQHIQDGMPQRAHCLSSDSVITLAKLHAGLRDRLHVVVNFGSGIHLGIAVLREQATHVGPVS